MMNGLKILNMFLGLFVVLGLFVLIYNKIRLSKINKTFLDEETKNLEDEKKDN